jgi:branched-chain amino acid aminotransferase
MAAQAEQRRPTYLLVDGELVPYQDAGMHVLSPALKYGIGVFEGFCGYWHESEQELYTFRVRDHLDRLADSIAVTELDYAFGPVGLHEQIHVLIRANELRENIHMRLQILLASDDGTPEDTGPTVAFISTMPIGQYFRRPKLDLCVSSWTRISDRSMPPRVKSIANYHNGRLASLEARRNGYDAPLLLTDGGRLAEGFGYNVFIVRKGRLATPALTDSTLEGITRDTVLVLAREELGLEVDERPIDRTELYSADEVFVCGSAAEVTPVSSVDRHVYNAGEPGELTSELRRLYLAAVHDELARDRGWTTPVYAASDANVWTESYR